MSFYLQLQDSIELVTSVLQHLLKTVTLIGCIILVFGQPYAYLALDLYGGSLLSSGAGTFFIIFSIMIRNMVTIDMIIYLKQLIPICL